MIENITASPLPLTIIAILLSLWSLIKSFRTRKAFKQVHERLNVQRRMVETAHRLAKLSYNRSMDLQDELDDSDETFEPGILLHHADDESLPPSEFESEPRPRFRTEY